MPDLRVSTALAGTLTLLALGGLGLFVYPRLMRRRAGILPVALITAGLVLAYMAFDGDNPSWISRLVYALVWAGLPLLIGIISVRMGNKRPFQS